MSLTGVRDISVIETPPEERYPVQTYVVEQNDQLIRDAILREVGRDGQVYFVYNRVEDIDRMAKYVQELVPEAKVGIAHGQMAERELEKEMMDFMSGEHNVLVCTTIIETGMDIQNVNTIIIYDSDKMGLSQLYQLRGRVGRSKEQGYCYLLSEATHSEQKERLEFLENHHDGFEVSEYDLKIRGPGDLLGQKQSGLPTFMIGDIFKDYHILEITRKDAFEAMNQHQDDEKIIKLLSEIKNNLIKNNEYID